MPTNIIFKNVEKKNIKNAAIDKENIFLQIYKRKSAVSR